MSPNHVADVVLRRQRHNKRLDSAKWAATQERITTETPYFYRCEPIFILYATGIPEPSDEECQEAHTLTRSIKMIIGDGSR